MTTQQTILESPTQLTASFEDMIQGLDIEKKKELVYARVKFFRGNLDFESHRTDIASTILHHKGKQEGLNGWSNLGEDIVIEKDTDIDNGLPIR